MVEEISIGGVMLIGFGRAREYGGSDIIRSSPLHSTPLLWRVGFSSEMVRCGYGAQQSN